MLRFILSLDENWILTTDAPGIPERRLVKADDGDSGVVPLLDPVHHAAEPPQGLQARSGADVKAAYTALMERNFQPEDPAQFGRYLFDCLLGANWERVQRAAADRNQWFIELALSWAADDAALSRLPWELMHGPAGYLSNGYIRNSRLVEVAITRLIPGSDSIPRQIRGVPRVLFAVGAAISDETLRPAAEIACLLKRTTEKQRRMYARMVEKCTPSLLRNAIRNFNPDVVHLICHGGIDPATRQPYLELQSETSDTAERVRADQLADVLRLPTEKSPGQEGTVSGAEAKSDFPPLVVMSACLSGSAMLGPDGVGPFAAQLVSMGVPIVVGMSGSVTDIACRLFTRRFAEAVLGAEPLVAATAEGRRAAFSEGKAPEKSIDWAYPTVFLSNGVPADFRPADAAAPPDPTEAQIQAYEIPKDPVFCGRQEFFEAFEKLLQPGGPSILAAYTADTKRKYGRTRLLQEIAVQAILEGHIPCLVSSAKWNEIPNTPLKLALAIDLAFETARVAFDLSLPPLRPARRLQLYLSQGRSSDIFKDDQSMQVELLDPSPDIPAGAAFLAIQQTCTMVIEAARAAHPEQFGTSKPSRVIVLLDGVEQYDSALTELLKRPALTVTGLGTKQNPVPLVLTFAQQSTATTVLDPIVQSKSSRPGWTLLELLPFKKNGENMLAYQRVLLNPFTKLLENVSDKQLVMDYGVAESIRDHAIAAYNSLLMGVPQDLGSDVFYAIAFMNKGQFLRETGDEAWLAVQEIEKRKYRENTG